MRACACTRDHDTRRIVLTSGPGARKTAVLEFVRRQFCAHVRVLPEAAGIVFGGRFPRSTLSRECRAAQRAIDFVQREPEQLGEGVNAAVVVCDRGTVDGAADWLGPGDFFSAVDTSKEREMSRYDAVIYLRTPHAGAGYGNGNPLRTETAEVAAAIDDALFEALGWASIPVHRRGVQRFSREGGTHAGDSATHHAGMLSPAFVVTPAASWKTDCISSCWRNAMRVLLAVDASPCSDAAVEEVTRRFARAETQVRVVHAVEWMEEMPLSYQFGQGATAGHDAVESRRRSFERAEALVNETAARLESAGFQNVSVSTPDADPRHGIVDEARAWKPDLIVIGSHGRYGLDRLLLGSVAEAVLRHAPCSIEIVREPIAAGVSLRG